MLWCVTKIEYGILWNDIVWCGMGWYGVVWCGIAWYGMAW